MASALALVAQALSLGDVLIDHDQHQFLVVGIHPPNAYSGMFSLVRIPAGMTPLDLGRRFRHTPTPGDITHAELIDG